MKHLNRRSVPLNKGHASQRRRGAVAAQVAVSLTVICGFTALAVDVGHLYNAKAELQRAADASALAAAMAMTDWGGSGPLANAKVAAQNLANKNKVLGEGVQLDQAEDMKFGAAHMGSDGKYTIDWTETDELKLNAVQVRLRRTEGSPSGPVPLYFARIFGLNSSDVASQATAVMTPRDIAFVLDLSGSHNDDSSLRSYRNEALGGIKNFEVYEAMWDDRSLEPQTDGFGFESFVSLVENANGTTTITVDLTSDDLGTTPALSNVTFTMPPEAQDMAASTASYQAGNGEYGVEAGWNPSAGADGLKYEYTADDDSYQLGENGVGTHTFSFTVPSDTVAHMGVVTKAGNGSDHSVAYNLNMQVTFGNMNDWGTAETTPDWDFTADAGLKKLQRSQNFGLDSDWVNQTAVQRGQSEYSADQVAVINAPDLDDGQSSEYWSDYKRRLKVALGIDYWDDSDGDLQIDSGEVTEMIPYPSQDVNPESQSKQMGGSWDDYIHYVTGRYYTPGMCRYNTWGDYYGHSDLKHRFGLKTFVDFVQEQVHSYKSPGMAGVPVQPMGAVADATKVLINRLVELECQDQVALASYGAVAYGPDNKPDHMSYLTDDLSSISSRVDKLYPGIWTVYTNIAAGIEEGRRVLFESPNARDEAAKVMIVLTDGNANRKRSGSVLSNSEDAKEAAREAVENRDPNYCRPVQVYTISVGFNADQQLMEEIAETIGHGEHEHAEGTVDTYSSELETIFRDLGSKRPVVLIE
jgi:hypothetical protein